jgi:hypothetical protein
MRRDTSLHLHFFLFIYSPLSIIPFHSVEGPPLAGAGVAGAAVGEAAVEEVGAAAVADGGRGPGGTESDEDIASVVSAAVELGFLHGSGG